MAIGSLAGVGESRSGGGAGAVAALVLECMMIPLQSVFGNAMRPGWPWRGLMLPD